MQGYNTYVTQNWIKKRHLDIIKLQNEIIRGVV